MATYDDLDALLADLENDIEEVLNNEVAQEVKKTMKEHIKLDVYSKYEPKKDNPQSYKRRKENGGLLDDENIFAETISKDTLMIASTRENDSKDQSLGEGYEADRDIPMIIETGQGYNWSGIDKKGRTNATPRPFTEKTKRDLEQNGQHEKALKKGLKAKGYDIE